ncbi:MAG: DUF488 domain-containing protein [Lewinellaceae bacterium]|nr:DUF488 domain-containing protein [Lewinellaceae bacterium]
MYYRRKILLSLLQAFDNSLDKLQLQKLLFLFSNMQKERAFDFVPYKYGCFSFQANADLNTLTKYGLVRKTEKGWEKASDENFMPGLKKGDKAILLAVKALYKGKTAAELIKITYKKYPYFALNSKIADQYLSPEELANLSKYVATDSETCLYTIGYEGISLERYLNKLIRKDIKVLCDVRKNALSMKFGFSKNQLKTACEGVGIAYYHLPEVGIESDQRHNLNNQADYDRLFEKYTSETLPYTVETQQFILDLLQEHGRVALTCFEAHSCQCHRSHLAKAIAGLPQFSYSLHHL